MRTTGEDPAARLEEARRNLAAFDEAHAHLLQTRLNAARSAVNEEEIRIRRLEDAYARGRMTRKKLDRAKAALAVARAILETIDDRPGMLPETKDGLLDRFEAVLAGFGSLSE